MASSAGWAGARVQNIKNSLLNNRVKLLRLCDYFAVSAPMISRRVLPLEKHRELKLAAGAVTVDGRLANSARMDALLDFVDEFATPEVFDAFLEGIKNCETSKGFAKILKKEAEAGPGGFASTGLKLPKVKVLKPKSPLVKPKPRSSQSSAPQLASSVVLNGPPLATYPPGSGFGFGVQWMPGIGNEPLVVTPAEAPPKPKPKPKAPRKNQQQVPNGPGTAGGPSAPLPANMPTNATATNSASTIPKPKPKAAPKKSAPKAESGTPAANKAGPNATATKRSTGGAPRQPKQPKTTKAAGGKNQAGAAAGAGAKPSPRPKPETKTITPGPSLTATLVYKDDGSGPSGSGAGPSAGPSSANKGGFNTKVPAGSPFRAKNGMAKSNQKIKNMSFQEAVDKQKSAVRAIGFSFINPAACVKNINFNNKSDLFYEGCPTKDGAFLCTKKVQLKGKGKKYVCKEKHENESYELFPRLDVTFEDSTTQLQATLYRENVEILAGKPVSDLHRMDDVALSAEFAKAYGQNIPIRVNCEKVLKKDLKKSGGAAWTNVATIITQGNEASGGPSAKKPRKSSAD